MIKLVRFLDTLSFDTAFGAASFMFVVGYSINLHIHWPVLCGLVISVLAIYNTDHLLDAYRLSTQAKSIRHAFYQQHFKALLFWELLLGLVGVLVLFYIPLQVVYAGLALIVAIGIYFLIIFKKGFSKYVLREVLVALGYTIAIALVPFADTKVSFGAAFYSLFTLLFMVALSNIWVFEIYETEIDASQNQPSITRRVAPGKLKRLVKAVLYITSVLIVAYGFFTGKWILALPLLTIELIYAYLLSHIWRFKEKEMYRLIGEYALLIPGLVLLIHYAI